MNYALILVNESRHKTKTMNNTNKEKTAGRDSALPKTPSGPTLPGRPVAELRFHGNVENNKVKKVSGQQKKNIEREGLKVVFPTKTLVFIPTGRRE